MKNISDFLIKKKFFFSLFYKYLINENILFSLIYTKRDWKYMSSLVCKRTSTWRYHFMNESIVWFFLKKNIISFFLSFFFYLNKTEDILNIITDKLKPVSNTLNKHLNELLSVKLKIIFLGVFFVSYNGNWCEWTKHKKKY